MENLLGLIVFVVIALISLVGKVRKKADEELPPPTGTPELEDLPETLRRLFMGEAPVPKARPAAPKQAVEVEPVIIVPPPRQRTPYQPPVARPAEPRQPTPPVAYPTASRVSTPSSPRPVARPTPPTVAKQPARPVASPATREEAPSPRFGQLVQQPRTLLRTPGPPSKPAARAQAAQPSAPRPPSPGHRVTEREGIHKTEIAHTLLHNLDDARRGIILSELLGPPLSLR
jgi:hypothetical protein